MNPTLKDEAYEACCSALYHMAFVDFLGETENVDGSTSAWFHLGEEAPRDMRVVVTKPLTEQDVVLHLEWRDPNRGRVSQDLHVSTVLPMANEVQKATQVALERVLRKFKEVVG